MKYIAKSVEVDAVQFLGEDEGMPSWVSVKGTKLPPQEREAEFYDQVTQDYPRASYSDWILCNGVEKWVLKDETFKKLYDPSIKATTQINLESKPTSPAIDGLKAPVIEGNILLGLGFR